MQNSWTGIAQCTLCESKLPVVFQCLSSPMELVLFMQRPKQAATLDIGLELVNAMVSSTDAMVPKELHPSRPAQCMTTAEPVRQHKLSSTIARSTEKRLVNTVSEAVPIVVKNEDVWMLRKERTPAFITWTGSCQGRFTARSGDSVLWLRWWVSESSRNAQSSSRQLSGREHWPATVCSSQWCTRETLKRLKMACLKRRILKRSASLQKTFYSLKGKDNFLLLPYNFFLVAWCPRLRAIGGRGWW